MPQRFFRLAVGLVIFYELSKWIFDLAGEPSLEFRKEDLPRNAADLRNEIPDLGSEIYEVFSSAVHLQVMGQYERAKEEYEKMGKTKVGDKRLNEVSKVLQYNLRLLDK